MCVCVFRVWREDVTAFRRLLCKIRDIHAPHPVCVVELRLSVVTGGEQGTG
jgi:hypothetical protein